MIIIALAFLLYILCGLLTACYELKSDHYDEEWTWVIVLLWWAILFCNFGRCSNNTCVRIVRWMVARLKM